MDRSQAFDRVRTTFTQGFDEDLFTCNNVTGVKESRWTESH